jgi:hypothetical protein
MPNAFYTQSDKNSMRVTAANGRPRNFHWIKTRSDLSLQRGRQKGIRDALVTEINDDPAKKILRG